MIRRNPNRRLNLERLDSRLAMNGDAGPIDFLENSGTLFDSNAVPAIAKSQEFLPKRSATAASPLRRVQVGLQAEGEGESSPRPVRENSSPTVEPTTTTTPPTRDSKSAPSIGSSTATPIIDAPQNQNASRSTESSFQSSSADSYTAPRYTTPSPLSSNAVDVQAPAGKNLLRFSDPTAVVRGAKSFFSDIDHPWVLSPTYRSENNQSQNQKPTLVNSPSFTYPEQDLARNAPEKNRSGISSLLGMIKLEDSLDSTLHRPRQTTFSASNNPFEILQLLIGSSNMMEPVCPSRKRELISLDAVADDQSPNHSIKQDLAAILGASALVAIASRFSKIRRLDQQDPTLLKSVPKASSRAKQDSDPCIDAVPNGFKSGRVLSDRVI